MVPKIDGIGMGERLKSHVRFFIDQNFFDLHQVIYLNCLGITKGGFFFQIEIFWNKTLCTENS